MVVVKFSRFGDNDDGSGPDCENTTLRCVLTLPEEDIDVGRALEVLPEQVVASLPLRSKDYMEREKFFDPVILETLKGPALCFRSNGECAWHCVFMPLAAVERRIKDAILDRQKWEYRRIIGSDGKWVLEFDVCGTWTYSESNISTLLKLLDEQWDDGGLCGALLFE
jgi:hypothetical protein